MPDVRPERRVERLGVPGHERLHLLQRVRVAPDGALPEDHQRPREDVGALDGDGHRQPDVGAGERVPRAAADGVSAEHVHRVIDRGAEQLGRVVLHHRRYDGRGGPLVQPAARVTTGGLHGVGPAADPRQRLLDALELADREPELLPDEGVSAGHAGGLLHAGRG